MIHLTADGLAPLALDDWAEGRVVTELEVGMPQPRERVRDRAGIDGTLDQTSLLGARSVTLAVHHVAGPSPLGVLLDRLAPFCDPTRRVTITHVDPASSRHRSLTVRGSGDLSAPWSHPSHMALTAGFRTVGWPFWTGAQRSITLAPSNGGGGTDGITPPLTPPIEFPEYVGGESIGEIRNAGDRPAVWQATIEGPCEGIRLSNQTTGSALDLTDLDLQAGQRMEIDSFTRSVTIDGQRRWSAVDPSTSTWWLVPPGVSRIRMDTTASAQPAQVWFRWADTYLM